MINIFERMLSLRYFRAKRKEGFVSFLTTLSVVGIALGVATLIVVISVFNGYRAEFLKIILGSQPHMTVFEPNYRPLGNYEKAGKIIENVAGVEAAIPIIYGEVLVSTKDFTGGALVRGIDGTDLSKRGFDKKSIKSGTLAEFKGVNNVIIGTRMAERLNLKVGDGLTLISPQGNVTAFGTIPRMKTYRIVAITEVGIFDFDNRIVFMPLEAAQLFFQYKNAVTQIEVITKHPDNLTPVRLGIIDMIKKPIFVQDWKDVNGEFLKAVATERFMMFMILTMIILIASFNIISNLTMFVKDKSSDIAILRTMGAGKSSILRVFLANGMILGLIGTLSGVLLGIVICLNLDAIRIGLEKLFHLSLFPASIYQLNHLPAKLEMGDMILICALSLGISFLATLYPAYRAAKLDPVEALKYE